MEKRLLEYAIRKANPPPFLLKTYMLVEDPATDAVVSWNEEGDAFVVWQPAEFARDLLPTLFKHCNFSSFVRQLNTYGFRKAATSRWEFSNNMFLKGKKELLTHIRRRKAWAHRQQPPRSTSNDDEDQRSSSTSSSSELSVLVDENKRLKKENGVLSSQLITTKNKCKELLDLVAIFTKRKEGIEDNNNNNEEKVPKLFGVRLQVEGERERKIKTTMAMQVT